MHTYRENIFSKALLEKWPHFFTWNLQVKMATYFRKKHFLTILTLHTHCQNPFAWNFLTKKVFGLLVLTHWNIIWYIADMWFLRGAWFLWGNHLYNLLVQAVCQQSVTPFDTSLKLGIVIPYDLTKIFDRRLQKFLSAILDFGGHLGFSRAKNSFFTKMAVVYSIFELELSKIHRIYFRACTNRWTFQFLEKYP